MIGGIRHVKVATGIERDRPRIIHLARFRPCAADDFNSAAVRIENLHAAVAKFADESIAIGIDSNVVRITHLTGSGTGAAKSAQELSIRRKDLDAVIT